ncbi:MAG: hypothetical protein RL122_267 [Pseudomonadota bacterium]|uniref:DUF1501 domain-containing protein n=2 Tax=Thiothrix fructosivorans TaxID=111770 RepID=A0ABS3III7_9GAMM|nr:DUF1501 domain-containing protein [Thiothrix fructosivorans]
MSHQHDLYSRRHFLKLLLGSSALGTVGQLALMQKAAATAPGFSDYKALVCVFLKGGNDSFNMLLPIGGDAKTGYAAYAATRGSLAITNNPLDLNTIATGGTNLNHGNLGIDSANPYYVNGSEETAYLKGFYGLSGKGIELGVNAVMPELAQLINDNKASVIANIGTLVQPVNRAQILAKTAKLPVFLFAHNHQQRILQTGQADNLTGIGWAGKIADQWQGINSNSPLGLNISYSGNDRMLIGNKSSPLILNPSTPPRYTEMVAGSGAPSDDRIAVFKALSGIENTSPSGKVSFDSTNTFNAEDEFQRVYASMSQKSFNTFDQLYSTWTTNNITYQSTGSYGEPLFSQLSPNYLGFKGSIQGGLISQLEAVAKMIHLAATGKFNNNAFNRQIFLVSLGGFDTHATQASKHPLLLRELSVGLWKFQKALEELGHANKVTTFTMSDFGRTMSNNGDGTDHAWGAHHIVMGGDGQGAVGNFQGGQMIGRLPDVTLAGTDDHDKQGRMIPGLAQDQLNATLCRWFGANESMLASIFPNLSHFETQKGVADSAYFNGLFA